MHSSSPVNITFHPSFQEPQQASLAPAAAVLTIPSPTSSPWGVLPSPWPHLWSSPATPCIMAAKMKTSLRPLQPPQPRMRDSQPLPMETPPLTDPSTAAKTNIPKPVLCWHFLSLIHNCHSFQFINIWTVRHLYPSRLLLANSCFLFSLLGFIGTVKCAQLWCTAVIIYPLLAFHLPPIAILPRSFFFMCHNDLKVFAQESICCQIPASVHSHHSPHFYTGPSLKDLHICIVGHYYHHHHHHYH